MTPRSAWSALLEGFGIRQEFSQTDIRQRMFEQTQYGFQGAGTHIGTRLGAADNVQGIADGRGQYLRSKSLQGVNMGNLLNELNTVPAAVINSSYKCET